MPIGPGRLDLEFPQGDDFSVAITFQLPSGAAINYTGHTFTAKLKYGSTEVSFAVDTTNIATGILVLSLTDVQTALLPSTATWNLQKTYNSITDTLLRGSVVVTTDEAP